MPNPMIAMMGVSTVGGIASANAQSNAANQASQAQQDAAERSIKLLRPYMNAGGKGLQAQMALMGLNGRDKQQAAIGRIEGDPLFQSQVQAGEDALLQTASATGGLRGGNTAAALAQFRPAMLSQQINDQMARYGGLATMGQNSAAGVGALQQQQGAAQAGGYLAQGQARANAWGNIAGGAGFMAGQFQPPPNATMFGKWGF